MPELSFEYGKRGDRRSVEEISSLYLRGIMLFPKTEEEARNFVRSAVAFGCADFLLDPSTGERSTVTEMMDAADDAESFAQKYADAQQPAVRSSDKADGKRGLHGGIVAGLVLSIPLSIAAKTKRMVGRGAAFRVLEMWLSREHRMIGAKERNLIKIWQHYQSVAHFWAAHMVQGGFPANSEELVRFVAMAEFIRNCAEAHRPERAREPLLDPKITWKLPPSVDIEPATYDFGMTNMPESWLKMALEGPSN